MLEFEDFKNMIQLQGNFIYVPKELIRFINEKKMFNIFFIIFIVLSMILKNHKNF